MKLKLLILIVFPILLFVSCKQSDAQFAENLITQFEQKSINSKNIDWKVFRKKVLESYKISKDSAIQTALKLNNNPHTYYSMPGKLLKSNFKQTAPKDTCMLYGYIKTENFANVGYIKVPKFMPNPNNTSEGRQKAILYIKGILDSIYKQDKPTLKAWIIDLRYNYGGDMWPMLISLSPFLENGQIGYFKSDRINEVWHKKDNEIYLGKKSQNHRVFNSSVSYRIKNKDIKVAVLIGKGTASAGEATAIALKSLPNVKFFGLSTRGLTTSNQPINMGNHETLILTTGFMQDSKGNGYIDGVKPDYKTCNYKDLNMSLTNWIYNEGKIS